MLCKNCHKEISSPQCPYCGYDNRLSVMTDDDVNNYSGITIDEDTTNNTYHTYRSSRAKTKKTTNFWRVSSAKSSFTKLLSLLAIIAFIGFVVTMALPIILTFIVIGIIVVLISKWRS